jgi:Flp pilus assembly protein CpaB
MAVGRTLLEPLELGQLVASKSMAERGAAGGASLAIPAGFRAVTIHPAESTGVVAMMRPGSRVDIQVLSAKPGEGTVLYRMMENVEVLAVFGGNPDAGARPVVTLLVAPREADRLSLADAVMRVRLVLRNPGDGASEGTPMTTPSALFSAAGR